MELTMEKYYSHGKVLLSGEYLVLKGSKSLAIPLRAGQSLQIYKTDKPLITWESFDTSGLFFTAAFSMQNLAIVSTNSAEKAQYILNLLKAAQQLNRAFLAKNTGYKIEARLEFDLSWGFGSSSTLIANVAQWAQIDAFKLNQHVSKGSGYDIACAGAAGPILFQLLQNQPHWKRVDFNPPFIDQLNLVYLNKKMPTENQVKSYLLEQNTPLTWIEHSNKLTDRFIHCKHLNDFQEIMAEHESLLGQILRQIPVQQKLFSDFNGTVKSLGAWGGDFVLSASPLSFQDQQAYFELKGYPVILPLKNWILRNPNDPIDNK